MNLKESELLEPGRLNQLRLEIVRMAHRAKEGHVPSALSILEPVLAVHALWDVGPQGQDTFILSKGHGCLALYAVLAELGLIEQSELQRFCAFGGNLGGHPDSTKVAAITASTGSLGHGYPIAAGVAYAKKYLHGSKGRVFALLGDGECNEGSIWETALLANNHNLTNLVTWVDFNHSGDRAINLGNLEQKWTSFGFEVVSLDGHDMIAIKRVLSSNADRPLVILGNSIKGQGVSFMENNPSWHHAKIDDSALARATKELS